MTASVGNDKRNDCLKKASFLNIRMFYRWRRQNRFCRFSRWICATIVNFVRTVKKIVRARFFFFTFNIEHCPWESFFLFEKTHIPTHAIAKNKVESSFHSLQWIEDRGRPNRPPSRQLMSWPHHHSWWDPSLDFYSTGKAVSARWITRVTIAG